MKIFLRLFFLAIFLALVGYIIYVETERYESSSIILLKDLSEKQQMDLSSVLLGQTSDTMQDSKVIELYMRSNEMYDHIDEDHNLSEHYVSEKLDIAQRLYEDTTIQYFKASKKNLVEAYNDDLSIIYDEPSGTLSLAFIHTDPVVAKKILEDIITQSDIVINSFSKENAEVGLSFIVKQREENRALFIKAIKELIKYQNAHMTIDPNLDVERKSMILATLETDLVKSEVDYNSKLKTWNPNGKEMRMLKESIINIKKSIKRVQKELAGQDSNGNELNTNVFDFELLRSDMEFSKEVYRQTLINQEQLKTEVQQNAKHLVVVTQPKVSGTFTYPNIIWDVFTWAIILFFLYSILSIIFMIIKDHQD
jgi:capsular polysaccharide transport system permease protein